MICLIENWFVILLTLLFDVSIGNSRKDALTLNIPLELRSNEFLYKTDDDARRDEEKEDDGDAAPHKRMLILKSTLNFFFVSNFFPPKRNINL